MFLDELKVEMRCGMWLDIVDFYLFLCVVDVGSIIQGVVCVNLVLVLVSECL